MNKIGYARVSTTHQNRDRQIAALRAEGCETIFRDKASGKSMKGRPELDKAIDALGIDDVLVVAEWNRATRSMQDGMTIIQRLADRGACGRGEAGCTGAQCEVWAKAKANASPAKASA